jgi:kynureninase
VTGHFTQLEGKTDPPPFLDIDDVVAEKMAPLVGASPHEVAVMETLTANLHLLMASFYAPTKEKYKIVLETKAFPSDTVDFFAP